MRQSSRLIIVVGIVLAVVAFVGILALGGTASPPAETPPVMVSVVTAATDIEPGTAIQATMLATTEVEQTQVPANSFRDVREVEGFVARRLIPANAIVRLSDFQPTTASRIPTTMMSRLDCLKG